MVTNTRTQTQRPASVQRESLRLGLNESIATARDYLTPTIDIRPSGYWLLEEDSTDRKRWDGYGYDVVVERSGFRWQVYLSPEGGVHAPLFRQPVSRDQAFAAAEREMGEIASRQ